jgi:hypothetical protein
MKKLLIITALILSGCATTEGPRVNIPIAVPCKAEIPAAPGYRYAPPYDSVFEAIRDLLGDRELSEGYEAELNAALKSCK